MVEPGPVQKIEHQHGWMATVYRPLPKTTGRCEDPLGMLTRLERTYAWTLKWLGTGKEVWAWDKTWGTIVLESLQGKKREFNKH